MAGVVAVAALLSAVAAAPSWLGHGVLHVSPPGPTLLFHPLEAGALPSATLLSAPALAQSPLLNGCEVTSLAMLFDYFGRPVSKMALAALAPRDPTPAVVTPELGFHGNAILAVTSWGNPEVGFVGSMTGANGSLGYGMYHRPADELINMLWPGAALDLTGAPFSTIEEYVAAGIPVVLWTTYYFRPAPANEWVTWTSPEGTVRATPWEHAVLLVGYSSNTLWINNPGNGDTAEPVPLQPFLAAWNQLGDQAVTISPTALERIGWRFPYQVGATLTAGLKPS